MNLQDVNDLILTPALSMLPSNMDTPEARVMMLAIGLQESRFIHRVQLIGNHRSWWQSLNGPARGWWQFESGGGVKGVLNHPSSRPYALHVLATLEYANVPQSKIHKSIAHNDLMAAAFARLLLWTIPWSLPSIDDDAEAWNQYIDAWRPGKPHKSTWLGCHQQAKAFVINTGQQ